MRCKNCKSPAGFRGDQHQRFNGEYRCQPPRKRLNVSGEFTYGDWRQISENVREVE